MKVQIECYRGTNCEFRVVGTHISPHSSTSNTAVSAREPMRIARSSLVRRGHEYRMSLSSICASALRMATNEAPAGAKSRSAVKRSLARRWNSRFVVSNLSTVRTRSMYSVCPLLSASQRCYSSGRERTQQDMVRHKVRVFLAVLQRNHERCEQAM